MKILKLDDFAVKASRAVTIFGNQHEIREISVGDFIEAMKKAEELNKKIESGEQVTADATLEQMIQTVKAAVPTLPDTDVRRLTFEQLLVLVKFVNGDDSPVVPGQTGTSEELPKEASTEGGEPEKK